MSPNEFDDGELRGGLQDLAPDVDVRSALDALRPRARRARTRHRARLAAGVTAGILLVGGGAVALTNTSNDKVSITPATSPKIADDTSTTTVPPPTTPTTANPDTTSPTAAPTDATTPDSSPPGAPSDSRQLPTQSTAPTSPTTDHGRGNDTAPDTEVRTYSSAGGSIDVHVAGGVLMLDDVRPAGGYDEAADKRVERDDRIRVEFERKDGNHQGQPPRVEVRIINGELVQTPVDPSS